jgi:hypothetical protein
MVNAVSFGRIGKRDNENNPTGGKWIGAGLGAAWGGYVIYKNNEITDEIDKFMTPDKSKKIAECKDFETLKKIINESNLSEKIKKRYSKLFDFSKKSHRQNEFESVQDYVKGLQNPKAGKPLLPLVLVFTTLVGLGIGAIIDHFRKDD